MTAPEVSIGNGHRLFLRDWGAGPPVLLLASWGTHSGIWAETMAALTERGLRTIAYDRRGHGRSTDPGVVDFDLLADDLAAVVDALDLRAVTLVAHSGASGEALRFVTRHGAQRLARLVLVGATGPRMLAGPDHPIGLPLPAAAALERELAEDLPGWIDRNLLPFAPSASARTLDWIATMALDTSRRILLDFQRAILQANLTAEAASLRMPVTIIHGDQDVSAPLDLTARLYAALIPGATLQVYEGVAHGVMVTHARRLANDIALACGH